MTKTVSRQSPSVNYQSGKVNGGTGIPVWAYQETVARFYPVPRVGRTLKTFIRFLAGFESEYGMIYPSIRTTAKQTGMSPFTIQRMRALAEQLGILKVGTHKRERRRASNLYEFTEGFRANLEAVMLYSNEHDVVPKRARRCAQLSTESSVVNSSIKKERAFSFHHRKKKRPLKLAE